MELYSLSALMQSTSKYVMQNMDRRTLLISMTSLIRALFFAYTSKRSHSNEREIVRILCFRLINHELFWQNREQIRRAGYNSSKLRVNPEDGRSGANYTKNINLLLSNWWRWFNYVIMHEFSSFTIFL